MKRFDEFVNEDFMSKEYANLRRFEAFVREECKPLGIYPTIEFFAMDYSKTEDPKKMCFHTEIIFNEKDKDLDVPTEFNKIKEHFQKYFYINMAKAGSTSYYDIYLDFEKLKESNIYKSIIGLTKFKL